MVTLQHFCKLVQRLRMPLISQKRGRKFKGYRNTYNEHEINTFLQLASNQEDGTEEQPQQKEFCQFLEGLGSNIQASLEAFETKESNASWKLVGLVSLSEAEVETLKVEYERKHVYLDRLANQIQSILAIQLKTKITLLESLDELDQGQADLESKRADYEQAKSRRDEENGLIKQQVASWSKR